MSKKKEQYANKSYTYCPACGHDSLKLDMAKKRENTRNKCYCSGIHFPYHRKGSKGCDYEDTGKIMARELDAETLPKSKKIPF